MIRFLVFSLLMLSTLAADQIRIDWRNGTTGNFSPVNLTAVQNFVLTFDAGGNPVIAAQSGSGSVATDAIWDAAGDLAVGSGANTSARLAMGTALQVLRVNAGATALEWGTAAGAGDMILASAQTNSGAKTFLDTTLLLRNAANTFSSRFTNAATAARVYTLKDADGTVAFTSDITGTNSGTNTGDQTITLTGDVTGTGVGTFAATIAANSVALTTDTTGNYAAGDGEAGAALTGDSATGFFSTGTLEDARIDSAITRDSEAAAAYQPLDADLTVVAAHTFGSLGATTALTANTSYTGAIDTRTVTLPSAVTYSGQHIHFFGTAAASTVITWPATTVRQTGGSGYVASTTFAIGNVEFDLFSDGTDWFLADSSAPAPDIGIIGFTSSDATAVATGKVKGFVVCPYAGTISGWSIVTDAGTATVKCWKIASGTAKPTVANVINTSGVAISSGTAVISTTVTDFTTTAVTANDVFAFDITAVSGVTEITFQLKITKT